ncbi:Beta-glucosidase B [Propionicimonas sp. T2.31MG-18]|uniref:GH1 family beta-glucosidase n=1 Tax=Propionicimonas sp. T2.31MG-18 TaxID=3157620 RepID=UPI0035E584D9
MGIEFPKGFLFGSATSSYQIEGAATEDGKEDSIWDVFCREPGKIVNGDDGLVACEHYHRYPEDVKLLADLGMNTYRFSVSWPRVMHADGSVNPKGMDFYSRLVDELLAHDIAPWLTLYHWDLPAALPGGWTNRATAERFVDYALAMHDRLGDRVRTWTTLNEPWCSSFLSYSAGVHAPGWTDPVAAIKAAHHLLLAHGWTVQALRVADPDASLGITLNFTPSYPASDSPEDVDVARRVDATANRFFIEPIAHGHYPEDALEDLAGLWPSDLVQDGDLAAISTPIDVLGVNYYTTNVFRAAGPGDAPSGPTPHPSAPDAVQVMRDLPLTAMGWEVDPDGLRRLLVWLHTTYTGATGTGLVITENGAAYDDVADENGFVDDQDRVEYLRGHLTAVHQAIEEGADVRGYLAWSLMDNFEWAEGYAKRFGVVRVDAEQRRIPKASAHWFADLARTGTIG